MDENYHWRFCQAIFFRIKDLFILNLIQLSIVVDYFSLTFISCSGSSPKALPFN